MNEPRPFVLLRTNLFVLIDSDDIYGIIRYKNQEAEYNMEEKFVITEINRFVMVGKNEYSTPMISFGNAVNHNELIFHF